MQHVRAGSLSVNGVYGNGAIAQLPPVEDVLHDAGRTQAAAQWPQQHSAPNPNKAIGQAAGCGWRKER